jgi:hypothetical protein
MRKTVSAVFVGTILAVCFIYAAYGQSQEYIDRIKKADPHIRFLEEITEAIETIESERTEPRVSRMRIFNITDLLAETELPDFYPPSPYVMDVEAGYGGGGCGGGISFNGDDDHEPRGYDPDEIIETIYRRTGRYSWPDEEGGFGTIEHHKGKLIVINSPKVLDRVKKIIEEFRDSMPPQVLSTVYLFSAEEDYLKEIRRKGSSVITPEAIKKLIADSAGNQRVNLLRTAYLAAYSSQSAYLFNGTSLTYQGDTDTSGAGGLTPICIFDPIINVFHEGLIMRLKARYNRHLKRTNITAFVSLSEVTAIEERTGIGGGVGEDVRKCKVETPRVDMQVVSGYADVPEGYGLLLGGSKLKTAQTKQKSFVVLIVPEVQK